jgi:hypothetical protein
MTGNYKLLNSDRAHRTAAGFTFPAGFGAIFHVRQRIARIGAVRADICAYAANPAVMFRAREHETRCGRADVRTVTHETEVSGFRMVASRLQTMIHGHLQTDGMTIQTILNACSHVAIVFHKK